jgi:hypothetical protein
MNVALSAEELAEYNALFDAQLDEWASGYEKALHVAFKKSGLPSVDDQADYDAMMMALRGEPPVKAKSEPGSTDCRSYFGHLVGTRMRRNPAEKVNRRVQSTTK